MATNTSKTVYRTSGCTGNSFQSQSQFPVSHCSVIILPLVKHVTQNLRFNTIYRNTKAQRLDSLGFCIDCSFLLNDYRTLKTATATKF